MQISDESHEREAPAGSRRRGITYQLASPPGRGAVLWVLGLNVVGTDGVMLNVRGNYSIPTNGLFWSIVAW